MNSNRKDLDIDYFSDEQFFRENFLLEDKTTSPDDFPNLYNISSAFFFQYQLVPNEVKSPEYVYVPQALLPDKRRSELDIFMSEWNICWESAQLRHDLFHDKIPNELSWIRTYEGQNIYLIPRLKNDNLYAYLPIYHMLPKRILKYYGLPLLKKGHWPFSLRDFWIENYAPRDLGNRLSHAFAYYIWPLLNSQSKINSYSQSDSITLLAHNLDYWIPYVNMVIEDRMCNFSRVDIENEKQNKLLKSVSEKLPPNIDILRPLKGGDVWRGEDEAWEVANDVIDIADRKGNLRAIIDAIKSNRVQEDFSERWSYEREDFERKLYKKRSKFKVKFVELTDTIPVQGPETEVENNLFWENFIALLNEKEKQIIILLRSGYTQVGEISKMLGYANHSPVSKALKKIRHKLEVYS